MARNNWICSSRYILLDDTIRNNITLNIDDNNYDKKKLEKSIYISQVLEFIKDQKNNDQIFVGEEELDFLEDKNKELV